MGGQTGLNTSLALEEMGVLDKFGVEMIGAKRDAIEMAEDRALFREAMDRLGIENPKAEIVTAPKDEDGKKDLDAGVALGAGNAGRLSACPPSSALPLPGRHRRRRGL